MPSYLRVLRRGTQNVRLLLADGTTTVVSFSDMDNWTCLDNEVQQNLTPLHRNPRTRRERYSNPENQADRIYVRVLRRGSRNVSVALEDGSSRSIPVEFFDTWLQLGSFQYVEWDEAHNYPNGRELSHLTFGIELEFVANPDKYDQFCETMRNTLGAGRFSSPLTYGRSSTTQWVLGSDSSVRSTSSRVNKRGYELTSPILKFEDASKHELITVLGIITNVFEGVVNRTCGTHIHVGNFARIVNNQVFRDRVYNFQRNYGAFEAKVFDRLVSPSRKGNTNQYCHTCDTYALSDRYHKINTQNIFGFGTLENRQHQGTLEVKKIWSWMELNGRYMAMYFHDPSLFSDTSLNLEEFMEKIHLNEETKEFFLAREAELN